MSGIGTESGMPKGNFYKPRYKIAHQTKSKIWPYKDSYLRRFYALRARRLRRAGLFRQCVLVAKIRKWAQVRRSIRPFRSAAGTKSPARVGKIAFGRYPEKRRYLYNVYKKQQLRSFHGKLKEEFFRHFYRKYQRSIGIRINSFYSSLESRLDRVFFRRRLVPTIFAAHQFIHHHGIEVNSVPVSAPQHLVRVGDTIAIPIIIWWLFFWDLFVRVYYRRWGLYVRRRRCFKQINKKVYSVCGRSRGRNAFNMQAFITAYKNHLKKKTISKNKAAKVTVSVEIPKIGKNFNKKLAKKFFYRVHGRISSLFFVSKKTFRKHLLHLRSKNIKYRNNSRNKIYFNFSQWQKQKQIDKLDINVKKSFIKFAFRRKESLSTFFSEYAQLEQSGQPVIENIRSNKLRSNLSVYRPFFSSFKNFFNYKNPVKQFMRTQKTKIDKTAKGVFQVKAYSERLNGFRLRAFQLKKNQGDLYTNNKNFIQNNSKVVKNVGNAIAIETVGNIEQKNFELHFKKFYQFQKCILSQRLRKSLRPRVIRYSKAKRFNKNKFWRYYYYRRPYKRFRLLRSYIKRRKKAIRLKKHPRVKAVHFFIPSYLQMDFRTLRAVKVQSPSIQDIYFPFRISLPKVFAFYRSRGF